MFKKSRNIERLPGVDSFCPLFINILLIFILCLRKKFVNLHDVSVIISHSNLLKYTINLQNIIFFLLLNSYEIILLFVLIKSRAVMSYREVMGNNIERNLLIEIWFVLSSSCSVFYYGNASWIFLMVFILHHLTAWLYSFVKVFRKDGRQDPHWEVLVKHNWKG